MDCTDKAVDVLSSLSDCRERLAALRDFEEVCALDSAIEACVNELSVIAKASNEGFDGAFSPELKETNEKLKSLIETAAKLAIESSKIASRLEVPSWSWSIQVWIPIEQSALKAAVTQNVTKLVTATASLRAAWSTMRHLEEAETARAHAASRNVLQFESLRQIWKKRVGESKREADGVSFVSMFLDEYSSRLHGLQQERLCQLQETFIDKESSPVWWNDRLVFERILRRLWDVEPGSPISVEQLNSKCSRYPKQADAIDCILNELMELKANFLSFIRFSTDLDFLESTKSAIATENIVLEVKPFHWLHVEGCLPVLAGEQDMFRRRESSEQDGVVLLRYKEDPIKAMKDIESHGTGDLSQSLTVSLEVVERVLLRDLDSSGSRLATHRSAAPLSLLSPGISTPSVRSTSNEEAQETPSSSVTRLLKQKSSIRPLFSKRRLNDLPRTQTSLVSAGFTPSPSISMERTSSQLNTSSWDLEDHDQELMHSPKSNGVELPSMYSHLNIVLRQVKYSQQLVTPGFYTIRMDLASSAASGNGNAVTHGYVFNSCLDISAEHPIGRFGRKNNRQLLYNSGVTARGIGHLDFKRFCVILEELAEADLKLIGRMGHSDGNLTILKSLSKKRQMVRNLFASDSLACGKCKCPLHRLPDDRSRDSEEVGGALSSRSCNHPKHEGPAEIRSGDPQFGCPTWSVCRWTICFACWTRDTGCPRCLSPICRRAERRSSVTCSWPHHQTIRGNGAAAADHEVFGCETMKICDYSVCRDCWTSIRLACRRVVSKSADWAVCGECLLPLAKLPSGALSSGWKCSWPSHSGKNYFNRYDSVYGCCTTHLCRWQVCENCWFSVVNCKDCHRPLSQLTASAAKHSLRGGDWTCSWPLHEGRNQFSIQDSEVTGNLPFACSDGHQPKTMICTSCWESLTREPPAATNTIEIVVGEGAAPPSSVGVNLRKFLGKYRNSGKTHNGWPVYFHLVHSRVRLVYEVDCDAWQVKFVGDIGSPRCISYSINRPATPPSEVSSNWFICNDCCDFVSCEEIFVIEAEGAPENAPAQPILSRRKRSSLALLFTADATENDDEVTFEEEEAIDQSAFDASSPVERVTTNIGEIFDDLDSGALTIDVAAADRVVGSHVLSSTRSADFDANVSIFSIPRINSVGSEEEEVASSIPVFETSRPARNGSFEKPVVKSDNSKSDHHVSFVSETRRHADATLEQPSSGLDIFGTIADVFSLKIFSASTEKTEANVHETMSTNGFESNQERSLKPGEAKSQHFVDSYTGKARVPRKSNKSGNSSSNDPTLNPATAQREGKDPPSTIWEPLVRSAQPHGSMSSLLRGYLATVQQTYLPTCMVKALNVFVPRSEHLLRPSESLLCLLVECLVSVDTNPERKPNDGERNDDVLFVDAAKSKLKFGPTRSVRAANVRDCSDPADEASILHLEIEFHVKLLEAESILDGPLFFRYGGHKHYSFARLLLQREEGVEKTLIRESILALTYSSREKLILRPRLQRDTVLANSLTTYLDTIVRRFQTKNDSDPLSDLSHQTSELKRLREFFRLFDLIECVHVACFSKLRDAIDILNKTPSPSNPLLRHWSVQPPIPSAISSLSLDVSNGGPKNEPVTSSPTAAIVALNDVGCTMNELLAMRALLTDLLPESVWEAIEEERRCANLPGTGNFDWHFLMDLSKDATSSAKNGLSVGLFSRYCEVKRIIIDIDSFESFQVYNFQRLQSLQEARHALEEAEATFHVRLARQDSEMRSIGKMMNGSIERNGPKPTKLWHSQKLPGRKQLAALVESVVKEMDALLAVLISSERYKEAEFVMAVTKELTGVMKRTQHEPPTLRPISKTSQVPPMGMLIRVLDENSLAWEIVPLDDYAKQVQDPGRFTPGGARTPGSASSTQSRNALETLSLSDAYFDAKERFCPGIQPLSCDTSTLWFRYLKFSSRHRGSLPLNVFAHISRVQHSVSSGNSRGRVRPIEQLGVYDRNENLRMVVPLRDRLKPHFHLDFASLVKADLLHDSESDSRSSRYTVKLLLPVSGGGNDVSLTGRVALDAPALNVVFSHCEDDVRCEACTGCSEIGDHECDYCGDAFCKFHEPVLKHFCGGPEAKISAVAKQVLFSFDDVYSVEESEHAVVSKPSEGDSVRSESAYESILETHSGKNGEYFQAEVEKYFQRTPAKTVHLKMPTSTSAIAAPNTVNVNSSFGRSSSSKSERSAGLPPPRSRRNTAMTESPLLGTPIASRKRLASADTPLSSQKSLDDFKSSQTDANGGDDGVNSQFFSDESPRIVALSSTDLVSAVTYNEEQTTIEENEPKGFQSADEEDPESATNGSIIPSSGSSDFPPNELEIELDAKAEDPKKSSSMPPQAIAALCVKMTGSKLGGFVGQGRGSGRRASLSVGGK